MDSGKAQITREELDEMYNGRRMTLKQIAQHFGVSYSTIQGWMVKMELPRRSQGEASSKLLDEDEIVRLYVEEQQSTREIARRMNTREQTISKRLAKRGIERRKGGPRKPLDEDEIERLYVEERQSTGKIARQMNSSPATIRNRLAGRGIERRNRSESNIVYPRRDFSGGLIEKAYLQGFCHGDVTVEVGSYGSECTTISVSANTTKIAQLNLYNELFSPYGHARVRKRADGSYSFKCPLNMSFAFLLEKQDRIPDWIMTSMAPKGLQNPLGLGPLLAFIAGYTDAEGYFGVSKNGKSAWLSLASYDVGLLRQIREIFNNCLDVLCPPVHMVLPKGSPVKSKRTGKVYYSNKDGWRLAVYRKASLYRLCELLEPYLRHADRRADMFAVWANVMARGV